VRRNRIVVYGVTGSGKTTLGRRLAAELGLRHIELDSLYHGPNWTPTPPDEFEAKAQAAIDASPDGWVADGNYRVVRQLLLTQADTAVWLHLPWRVSYLSMVRRTFTRAITRKELWNGNKESLRLMFLDKESLLLWGIHHHRASIRSASEALYGFAHTAEIFDVRSRRQLDDVVRRFVAERAEAAGEGSTAPAPA
jgi:adenylate kinase family enzyme